MNENQDYIKLNEITFKFLQKLYGGKLIQSGPEVSEIQLEPTTKNQYKNAKRVIESPYTLQLKPKGLQNTGANCYLNASLQCLFSISELNYYFLSKSYENLRTRKPKLFCKILHEIIQDISTNQPLIILTKLQELLSKQFTLGMQQDCHELLIYMLDAISCELSLPQVKQLSIIEELFQGQTESQVECLNCGNLSKIKEINLGLSVNYGPGVKECIEEFCSKEIIEEYSCEKCRKKGKAARKIRLLKTPRILIVQIKKFDSVRKKNYNFQFEFNSTLNIADSKYKLIAFIVHKGWLDFGHYYAYCKRFDQWFVFDDEYYTQIQQDDIDINHAYLLFYQKI